MFYKGESESMSIKVKNYTKRIKGRDVLRNINIEFENGIVYGIKGINGSGKTMLIRAICGLITATSGLIEIDGKVIGKDISFLNNVGILIENPAFIDHYTGFYNLKLLASIKSLIDEEEIKNTILKVGLDPLDNKKYRKYSLGMKQRLGIAAAIMEKPDVLLLDEPTNALDFEGITMLKNIISEMSDKKRIIILTSHDESFLNALCNVIIHMEDGEIINVEKIIEE